MQGTLVITVIKAEIFKSTEWFGRMDPYTIIQTSDQIYKTEVHQDADKHPVWNYQCSFRFNTDQNNQILYKVMNSCTGEDEELGYGRCQILQLYDYDGKEISVAIQKDGEPKGNLIMRFDYHLDKIKQQEEQQSDQQQDQQQDQEQQQKALEEQEQINRHRRVSQTMEYKVQQIKDKLSKGVQQLQDEIKQLNTIGEQFQQEQKEVQCKVDDKKTQTKELSDRIKQMGIEIQKVETEFTKNKQTGFSGKLAISNLQLISDEKDSWNKLDPYLNIYCGANNCVKSSVVDNGGNNCKWKDNINIEFKDQFNIGFELYDKCTFGDDKMLGVAVLPLLPVFSQKSSIVIIQFNRGAESKHKIQVQYDLTV